MKQRHGFVSNSSSSSFMIEMKYLSAVQLQHIIDHEDLCEPGSLDFPWSIEMCNKRLIGSVSMDNFDMREHMENAGVPMEHVEWDEWNNWRDDDED